MVLFLMLGTFLSTSVFARTEIIERKQDVGQAKLLSVHGCNDENFMVNNSYRLDNYRLKDGKMVADQSVESHIVFVNATLVKEYAVRTYQVERTFKKKFFSRTEYLFSEKIIEGSYSPTFIEKRTSQQKIETERLAEAINQASIDRLKEKCNALEYSIE